MTNGTIEAMARAIADANGGHWQDCAHEAKACAAILFDALAVHVNNKPVQRLPEAELWLAQARTDTLGQPRQSDLTADDGAEGGR